MSNNGTGTHDACIIREREREKEIAVVLFLDNHLRKSKVVMVMIAAKH